MKRPAATPQDQPRSLVNEGVRQRRRAMLTKRHIAPLSKFTAALRKEGRGEVPDFDPLDGGVHARVLFLFEKPGPMTATKGRRKGSGFISRNNNDPTAEATFHFMQAAKLPRKMTIIWNVIPWWNGTRTVTTQELREGLERLKDLIMLLPRVRTVVLVGAKAVRAKPYLEHIGLAVLTSDHPSPIVRRRWPKRWRAIPGRWAKVKGHFSRSRDPIMLARKRSAYLRLRRRYKPKRIKLIIVAESPPASGRYFYDPRGRVTEPLFAALTKQLP
jgi:hypothetical protein